jgi:hypothetical protein
VVAGGELNGLGLAGEVLVQEVIKGPDDDIYFCLFYQGRDGEPIGMFTGRKTPLRCRDGFWFFGCLRSRKSSSWDILGLCRAEGLTESWTRHAHTPLSLMPGSAVPRAPSSNRPAERSGPPVLYRAFI